MFRNVAKHPAASVADPGAGAVRGDACLVVPAKPAEIRT